MAVRWFSPRPSATVAQSNTLGPGRSAVGRAEHHEPAGNLIAPLALDEPARDQAPHRVRRDVERLAVSRPQADRFQPRFEQAAVVLDRRVQVLVVEGQDQVVQAGERLGVGELGELDARDHALGIADDAVDEQQDALGLGHAVADLDGVADRVDGSVGRHVGGAEDRVLEVQSRPPC